MIITTHVQDAISRLVEQYKNKGQLAALITAFVEQTQGQEQTLNDLLTQRSIYMAVGVQLDLLGTILGQARDGLEDEPYRIRLKTRVLQNISQGQPEALVAVFQLLVGSTLVEIQEWPPAGVGMGTDASIDPGDVNSIYANVQLVAPAGVRVDHLWCFDTVEPFSFDGTQPGLGFGTVADAGVGGKFGFLHNRNIPFSFAGGDPSDLGFSTIADPLVGGNFQSL